MLVHLHNEQFPYKTPGVSRIKSAFAALLQHKVTQSFHRTRRLPFEEQRATATVAAQVTV